MTAAATPLVTERGRASRYRVLFCPVMQAPFDTETYEHVADGPWLTRKAMQRFWAAHAADVSVRAEPTA
jgi:acetyl esterase